jgi:hypothetical protein
MSKYLNSSVNPVKIETPIYGSTKYRFGDFIAPAMIVVLGFSHSISKYNSVSSSLQLPAIAVELVEFL